MLLLRIVDVVVFSLRLRRESSNWKLETGKLMLLLLLLLGLELQLPSFVR